MEKKYHIPDFYESAQSFYPTNFQDHESGRKILSEENANYNTMQNVFPIEIGETIQHLYEKEGFMLGIHRATITDETLFNSYFKKGLKNNKLEYDNTISVYKYFPTLLKNIISCESNWKNSKGCLLILIPKEPYTPFYQQIEENGQINNYILPTYIHSYIKVNNKEIIEIIYNPYFGKDFKITDNITYDKYIVEKEIADKKLEELKKKGNV